MSVGGGGNVNSGTPGLITEGGIPERGEQRTSGNRCILVTVLIILSLI